VEPARVTVSYDERYFYPSAGGVLWLAGYQVLDEATGRYLARNAPELAERGLRVAGVAGARHQPGGLDSEALAPGRPLVLRRDPDNEHDPHAIAVEPADGGAQAGWVPAEVAVDIAPDIDAGRPWSAVVLRERRDSPRDPRTGVTMLLAAGPAIELVDRPA
jgi:hypothetical protein